MIEQNTTLGKLSSEHGISIAFTQRALVVAVVSFIFFIIMLVAFSYRQNIGYFILGTAFLIVEIFTLIGWFVKRKTSLLIFEKGFIYKDKATLWEEVAETHTKTHPRLPHKINGFTVVTNSGQKILLTDSIEGFEDIINVISIKTGKIRQDG